MTLVKQSGDRFEDVQAGVHGGDRIMVGDAKLVIDEGDVVLRRLPNGKEETYHVEEAIFHQGFHSIPARWELRVRKSTVAPTQPIQQNIYYLNGANARVYHSSHDASNNIVQLAPDGLFAEMRRAVEERIDDVQERAFLLARIDELAKAQGGPEFRSLYIAFMGVVADHLAVLGPFLPGLAQMLG